MFLSNMQDNIEIRNPATGAVVATLPSTTTVELKNTLSLLKQ